MTKMEKLQRQPRWLDRFVLGIHLPSSGLVAFLPDLGQPIPVSFHN